MLEISDALSFFRLSCGRWTSQRSQHHLLHRRAEAGASFIVVEELLKGDERLAEIAERNNASVEQIVGGCWVRWSGSMAWDRACLLYTSPSPRDPKTSRMPSSA